jgi:hypothetical protein
MGWEFAALWLDESAGTWKWVWRRVADDSGDVLEESAEFERLEDCIDDARKNGFEESGCGDIESRRPRGERFAGLKKAGLAASLSARRIDRAYAVTLSP